MTPHFIGKRRNHFNLIAFAIAFVISISSCTDGTGGDTTCEKCIDHKPPATPYSNTLNAINHNITLSQGVSMINDFAMYQDSILNRAYLGTGVLPLYETFNLKAIDTLICQKNAVGFRVYMAMDKQRRARFVLVGVDGDGKDIIQRYSESPRDIAAMGDVSVLIEEAGQRWP